MRRDGGDEKPGSYKQKHTAMSDRSPERGRRVLTWGKFYQPVSGQEVLVVTMGNPLALSGMGARLLNDLWCSGPPTLARPVGPTHPLPPADPSEDHDTVLLPEQVPFHPISTAAYRGWNLGSEHVSFPK